MPNWDDPYRRLDDMAWDAPYRRLNRMRGGPITTKKAARAAPEPAPVVPFWDDPAAYEQFTPQELWSPWDTGTIDGLRMPGLVAVRSRKRRKLFVAGEIGSGEAGTDTGAEAPNIEIQCQLWLPAHLAQYGDIAAIIRQKGGTRAKPKTLRVDHPGLALLGIKDLYITSVGVPERKSPGGVYTAVIEAVEFDPTAVKKGKKTKGGVYPIAPGADPRNAIREKMEQQKAPSADPSQAKP